MVTTFTKSILLALGSFLAVSLIVTNVSAQDLSLLAKYGGKPKSTALQALDEKFKAAAIKEAKTPEAASEILVTKGFTLLKTGNAKEAMRRFNQAWLFTPEDKNVLWGLGDASAAMGDYAGGLELLDEVQKKNPKDANVSNDIGFTLMQRTLQQAKSKNEAEAGFNQSKQQFLTAASLEPKNDRAYMNLAIIAFYLGDLPDAWTQIKKAEALGGKSVDPKFVADLSKMMPRP